MSKIIALNDGETSATVKTELQLLKALPQHVNLVNYKRIQITSEKNLYLIMEYCNEGNLEKQLFACKYQFSEDKIWFFLRQFCEGYKVLYNNAILHRDIKPENILVHNGDYKIADFGLSRMVQDPEAIANLSTKGTPIYMAPELHNLREGSSKLDVFSLGIVLYRMAYEGKYPYYDKNRQYRSVSEYFAQLKLLRLAIPSNNRSDYLNQMI